MKAGICLVFLLISSALAASPLFAPYYDMNLEVKPTLSEVIAQTGQKVFTLAFALGGGAGCEPLWGAMDPIDDPKHLDVIRAAQSQGAEFVIATGGAVGPYLEHMCLTPETLATAYKKVLDTVKATHLDVDIEASVNLDVMNKALAQVQRERPEVTVSFTLPVQGDDYGLTPALGVDVLKSAKANGVRVDIVNAMAMEYPSALPWGQSVINAGIATMGQMAEIWPEKSQAQLRKMLGITPMIGRNMSGKIFELAHARQLVEWANNEHIGLLAFWSIGRDNGRCPGGGVSPTCSSISQDEYEMTKIFQGFKG